MRNSTYLLGAVAMLAIAPRALTMHTHLVKAEPGVDSTVAAAPKQVRLWFNEAPEVALSAATLTKEDHSPVAVIKMAATDDSLSVAGTVPVALAPGKYMVMWRTGSKDGHAVRGMYLFTYDPAVSPNPDVHPDEGPLPLDLYAFGRGLAYLATLVLIGTCVYAALIPRWRGPSDDDRSLAAQALTRIWTIAGAAAALLILAHLIRAYGQVRSFLDPTESFTWEAARPVLFQTTWGKSWLIQLVVACLTLPVALLAGRRPPTGLALLGTAALAVAATSPLTGHAVANPWGRPLGVGLHALHLVGGGVWLGTLFSMVVAGLRSTSRGAIDHAAVARMVAVFSPVALTGAALAVTAGTLMAYSYIGDLSSLFGSTYGRALLVKVTLLAIAMALGAWNWRKLSPRLGSAESTGALTRSATIELLIGALIVATTAVLVALPAPQV